MKKTLLLFLLLSSSILINAQPIKIMLITGGHAYDTIQFFQMFDALKGIEYEHFQQPEANQKLLEGVAKDYDVLVFYDMWKTISEEEKEAYLDLTKKGKPMLFFHHSLANYPDWDTFEELLGGRYILEGPGIKKEALSTYRHDVWVEIKRSSKHPAAKGLKSFKLFDEVYGNFRVSENVTPILMTNHPESTAIIAWENFFNSSKILYLQPGHDYHAYESKFFRKLIRQSIRYLTQGK